MDITAKIESLLAEKEEKIKAEIEAHARIIVIDKQVKQLRRALKEVEEILNPGFDTGGEVSGTDAFKITSNGVEKAEP